MTNVASSYSSIPRNSMIFWSRHWIDSAVTLQDHGVKFPVNYITGALAIANLITLPFTLVLDPIAGVWKAVFYEPNPTFSLPPNPPKSISPILHLKVALKSAYWTALVAAPVFACYIVSAISCMLCSLHIPRIGRFLGGLSVIYLMHFPAGWYGVKINQIFVETC